MEKISPLLQILLSEKGYLDQQKERSFLSDEMANLPVEPEKVSFFLEYKDSLEPLKALGLEVLNAAGHVVVGRIDIDKVLELSAHSNVVYLEQRVPPSLCLDNSIPEIKANMVRTRNGDNWSGMTGEDVLIGIVDTGIDFTHKTFRNPDNTTRLIGIWDQTLTKETGESVPGELPIVPALDQLPGQPPNPVVLEYGVEYDRDKINEALSSNNPHSIVRHKDTVGHGTHVASIAGGDGSQSGTEADTYCDLSYKYVGVAPKAEFVIVKVDFNRTGWLVDAIRYIIAVKNAVSESVHRTIPVVINFSIVDQIHRRDVKGVEETMIDEIMNVFPNSVAILFAAGNEGNKGSHCTATINPGGQIELKFQIPQMKVGAPQPTVMVAIAYSGTNLQASIKPPSLPFLMPPTQNGATQTFNSINGSSTVSIANNDSNSTNPNRQGIIMVTIQAALSGEWTIRLQDNANTSADIQAWIMLDPFLPPAIPYQTFSPSTGVNITNISSISAFATAENPIFVGAYTTEDITGFTNGELASFSSRGPIQIPRLPADPPNLNIRPHITAPGVAITSALSGAEGGCCCDCCYDFYKHIDGTSQATPHVTGAVALMLQKNPTLGFQQIRQILQNTARTVDGQNLPNNDWGWGKLDVQAALNAVPALAPAAPLPPAGPASPVAFSTLPPQTPWLQLREEFSAIPRARFYQRLVADHFPEVRQLINTNKRVATVWHRNSGTALLRIGMQAAYQPDQPLPFEIEGITIVERLRHIAEILKKYGSDKLSGDIETYVKNWITLLDGGLSVRQLLHVFKQQETLSPITA